MAFAESLAPLAETAKRLLDLAHAAKARLHRHTRVHSRTHIGLSPLQTTKADPHIHNDSILSTYTRHSKPSPPLMREGGWEEKPPPPSPAAAPPRPSLLQVQQQSGFRLYRHTYTHTHTHSLSHTHLLTHSHTGEDMEGQKTYDEELGDLHRVVMVR